MDKLEPGREDTKRTLGWKMLLKTAVLLREDFDKAEKIFDQTARLARLRLSDTDPALAYVLMEVAEFYAQHGRQLTACKYFQEARKILGDSDVFANCHDQSGNEGESKSTTVPNKIGDV